MPSIRDLVFQAVYAALKDAQAATYHAPPEPEPINSKNPIDIPVRMDTTSTKDVKRKVLEWQVRNVSKLKTVPGKETKVRELVAKAINQGWSKKQLEIRMIKDFDLKPNIAKRIAVNEVRRSYNWSFKKTSYELGYRNAVWRAHPGCCKICLYKNGRIYALSAVSIPEDSHPGCRCWLELTRKGFVSPVKRTLPALPKL